MAAVTLNVDDYEGQVGGESVHELTRGLDVRFDEVSGAGDQVEFTGSREDIITVITRFTDDPTVHKALISQIK